MREAPFLAWAVYLGAIVALPLADPFPVRLTFLTPASFHPFLVAAETLFVLFAWPFLGGGERDRVPRRELGLVVLALPLAFLAENLSAAGAGPLVRGQVLVLALAALASALRPAEKGRGPAYLLAASVLCAVPPIAAFVTKEFAGRDLGWLALFSPVWAAVEIGRGSSLALTGLAAAGAALLRARA
jgi:hypothetical protein